uniref:Protein kinase domain-containing protein n=2 Tax=Eutreptiella gymnastica TaxID=73025 RepID=A0A7S1INQ3_9EUGL|mmetsp:Transcript_32102/g.57583  ORF Transcript_32102/g.57583 Transcript_32102/m.57583 type:complete len:231 (+) Transcript_32102:54-746(+)
MRRCLKMDAAARPTSTQLLADPFILNKGSPLGAEELALGPLDFSVVPYSPFGASPAKAVEVERRGMGLAGAAAAVACVLPMGSPADDTHGSGPGQGSAALQFSQHCSFLQSRANDVASSSALRTHEAGNLESTDPSCYNSEDTIFAALQEVQEWLQEDQAPTGPPTPCEGDSSLTKSDGASERSEESIASAGALWVTPHPSTPPQDGNASAQPAPNPPTLDPHGGETSVP